MRCLVTGGGGFIGSNLVEALLKRGADVVVLDNFLTGRRENLAAFAGNPRFTLIEDDIRDFSACRKGVSGCDCVFHEAALGSVPRSMANPQATLEINAQGFVNVIEAARAAGVMRFIYASSSSVYGDDTSLPKVESSTGRALSPYALSKQMNEKVAEHYGRIFGMGCIGLRYFNVFGRRQDPAGAYAAVIPKFAECLIGHRSPVINGDGSTSRDFTYIDNVVQANLLAMTVGDRGALNQVYNVARGERTTLSELFTELRANLSEFDAEISRVEPSCGVPRAGDIPHSLACIDKARKQLGYNPEFSVSAGLREAARWYYENLRPALT